MLGPCLGKPLSDQLRHIVECCKPHRQELDKKRDSYIKAHWPEPGGRGLSGLLTDQKHCANYACKTWPEKRRSSRTLNSVRTVCKTRITSLGFSMSSNWLPNFQKGVLQRQDLINCWISAPLDLWLQVCISPPKRKHLSVQFTLSMIYNLTTQSGDSDAPSQTQNQNVHFNEASYAWLLSLRNADL